MGARATRRQAGWVIGATVVLTVGVLVLIRVTVPSRSQAIEEAVRAAAGATVTDTVMATVTVTETPAPPAALEQTPAPPAALAQIPEPVETPAAVPTPALSAQAPPPAAPEVVHPGSFCSDSNATGVTEDGTSMVCTTTAEDERDRWRSAG